MPDQSGRMPRLALSKKEAARSLGVSVEFFDKHIAPEVPAVHRGRRRLYAVEALREWLRKAGRTENLLVWPSLVRLAHIVIPSAHHLTQHLR